MGAVMMVCNSVLGKTYMPTTFLKQNSFIHSLRLFAV